MALFPAYIPTKPNNEATKKESPSWLHNASCPPDIPVVSSSLPDSETSSTLTPNDCKDTIKGEKRSCDSKSSHKNKKQKKFDEESKSSAEERETDYELSSHKRKSKKSSERRSSKSSKKHKKKSKSHKKRDRDTSKNEETSKHFEEDKCLQIPIHNGESKNIFLEAHLHSFLPENLGKVLYYDTMPDKNNSIFCNTHYSQVANYFRLSTQPLGLVFAQKRKKKKDRRYFSKYCRLLPESRPVIKLTKDETNAQYIPLNLTYEEEKETKEISKSLSTMKSLGILDSATEDYILDRSKTTIEESESIQAINPEKKYWQERIKSYNERLVKEPHNVALWLEFVDIQDRAIPHILKIDDNVGSVKGKSFKLLIERKISVLDTAIAKNVRSLELHLKRLQLGENVWDNKKLHLEWDRLITNFPNDLNMWHHYLIFHQSYFSTFNLDRVVQAFAKCSDRLIQMQQGTFLSHKPPENISYAIIDLAVQLAYVWYQGGYMERSIALFQALIELNFFSPRQLRDEAITKDSKLAFFEAFWDSKAPRFGEKDSIGWSKFMEKREPVIFLEEILEGTHDEEDEILTKGGSRHDLWIKLESSRELNHWLPWQQDPENCEDTERMVSFSVLKKHLFFTGSEAESFYLIVQFLIFLGVPVPDRLLTDRFPSSIATSVFQPLRLESLKPLKSIKDLSDEGIFHFPVIGPSISETTSESYFSFVIEIINRSMSIISVSARPKLGCIFIMLLSERLLVLRQGGVDVSSTGKGYKKIIKNLLKQNEFRNNLDIYYEYGRFERSLHCYEEAIKIHSMALALGLQGNSNSLFSDENGFSLWDHLNALIHLHLREDKVISQHSINQVLNIICSVILDGKVENSQTSFNGLQVLRVKKKLSSFLEIDFTQISQSERRKIKFLNPSIKLLSLCQLLSVGFKPACLVFEEFLAKIENKDLPLYRELQASTKEAITEKQILETNKEQLYEDYLWLISVAPKIAHIFPCLPMSVSSVRQILKSATALAPNKVVFLQKLAEYESWRDILCCHNFDEIGKAGILAVVFKIMPHIKKVTKMLNSAEFGVVSAGHILESRLEAAVSSPSGVNCPLLWRLYLRLIQVTKPVKLKQVAYRALNSCPHAKCLYMDFVMLVPDALPDVLKLMVEKGIRVRLPLEELDVLLEEELEHNSTFEDVKGQSIKEEEEGGNSNVDDVDRQDIEDSSVSNDDLSPASSKESSPQ